uniref:Uncharacterized protein n=1 Tax=Tanacetum cinerariifolium TaxID=118510 RepID=A0A6L2N8K8_TANCI|nr:hypothetical protein [Tanacetum cinerariifolium]
MSERDLNNKSDVFESESYSSVNESEEDNNQANDRYRTGKGYHAVPLPYTGNFMPPKPDLSFAGLDDFVFKSTISETVTSVHEIETSTSKISKESMEKPKTVRSSALIIEDWEFDSDDDCEIKPLIEQNKTSHVKINFVESDKKTRKSVIEQHTYRQADNLRKVIILGRNFVPSPVITNSSKVPVNTAKQSFPRATASISTSKYFNTATSRPTMNGVKPSSNVFHKSHSPVRRTFNQRTTPKNSDLKEKVNTAKIIKRLMVDLLYLEEVLQEVVNFLAKGRHLKLEDFDGISTLPNTEIFEKLALIGNGEKLGLVDIPLFQTMLVQGPILQGKGLTVLVDITHSQVLQQPHNHHFHHPLGYQSDRKLRLTTDKEVYSIVVTKLIMKVKKLEKIVKSTKARRRAKIVVSDDEDAAEDTSKQGRKIDEIDQDPNISLLQHDVEVQERHEQETKFETKDISTAKTLVYIRRNASKNKERQRIARVHEKASSFNVEEWEDIQAIIEADEELALRIQAEEREKYSKVEKARLLVELINQIRRHFAQQRAKERRNKPITQAQQRTYMSNYVKHVGSHTLKQLKKLSFKELKNLFEETMKKVKTFTPMESDFDRTIPKIADESLKSAAEEELEQKSYKRQKTKESSEPREKEDDESTQEDLQQMMMMVPVEEVYVETPQVKYPIIDWEIYIEESKKY